MKPSLAISDGRLWPAGPDDLDALTALLHDAEVRRYLCDDTALPPDVIASMLSRSEQLDPRGLGLWVIESPPGRFAGIAGLEPASAELAAASALSDGIEPIIALNPGQWGQGLAAGALDALITHARDVLGLPRLVAAVDAPNMRSHRLMQACGFQATGRVAGPVHELVLYDLPLRRS